MIALKEALKLLQVLSKMIAELLCTGWFQVWIIYI